MAENGYSVGRDISLTVITSSGKLSINAITGFSSHQKTAKQTVKKLDGNNDPLRFFEGWAGSFDVERQDSNVEDYFVQLEENYYSGVQEQPATILETVENPDKSISQYRYEGVILSLDNAGEWRGDSSVKIKLSFEARRKKKIQ